MERKSIRGVGKYRHGTPPATPYLIVWTVWWTDLSMLSIVGGPVRLLVDQSMNILDRSRLLILTTKFQWTFGHK